MIFVKIILTRVKEVLSVPEIKMILNLDELKYINLHNKNLLIIDTLRTGTTIITALANGIEYVYPFTRISSLVSFYNKKKNRDKYICAGEYGRKRIKGFDLGNSPLSFNQNCVKNKILLLKTSNRSIVLNRISRTNTVFIGSLVNSSKVAEVIFNKGQDVYLICAGRSSGGFSLEDFFTAGRYCYLFKKAGWDGDDLTKTASRIYENNSEHNEIVNLFFHSKNGRDLLKLGYVEDIKFSSRIDIIDIVPIFDGFKISDNKIYYEEAYVLGV